MLFNLSDQNSIANQFISELRDRNIQQDRMKFRKNLERLGQVMSYEISKTLSYQTSTVKTPLGISAVSLVTEKPVLITVMRAGLPYFQGFLDYFDNSDCGFIGAYRREGTDEVVVNLEYLTIPSIAGKIVILIDPMLATGNSLVQSINALTAHGIPAHIHVAVLVAVPEGIEFLSRNIVHPHTLWTCAVDETLNDKFYILPGLGDAGDLSFGEKL
ncbi:MAG TPA: uracil phosphoribosyltransferase [Chryseolinea sp.]|nr:uracil phosphoribosyltransferase [Chryseolinea sp.]